MPTKSWRPFGLRGPTALATVAVLGAALGLGKAKYYMGDFAAAEEDLRRHLEAEPKDCEGQLFLGLTLKVFGDLSGQSELVVRGSLSDRNLLGFYLQQGRLVATLAVG